MLCHSFGSTHNVGWIYGFIRGNQNESLDSILICHSCRIPGAEHIVLYCLFRISFHKRYVFVCRRMKNNVRTMCAKDFIQSLGIAHGTNLDRNFTIRENVLHLLLELISVILVNIKDNQFSRAKCCNLTTQL